MQNKCLVYSDLDFSRWVYLITKSSIYIENPQLFGCTIDPQMNVLLRLDSNFLEFYLCRLLYGIGPASHFVLAMDGIMKVASYRR